MADFDVLWQSVAQYNPIILTGVPKEVPDSANDKRAWVDKHIGKDQPMIACLSKEKSLHMRNKGDIMIDDWDKYRQLWLNRNGHWITHISRTIAENIRRNNFLYR